MFFSPLLKSFTGAQYLPDDPSGERHCVRHRAAPIQSSEEWRIQSAPSEEADNDQGNDPNAA
jgi:hypothetical protein